MRKINAAMWMFCETAGHGPLGVHEQISKGNYKLSDFILFVLLQIGRIFAGEGILTAVGDVGFIFPSYEKVAQHPSPCK